MSEEETEPELFEALGLGVEDAGNDDDAAGGVEVEIGCVVGGGESNVFPELGVPFGLSVGDGMSVDRFGG
jgi:hypothetical protein